MAETSSSSSLMTPATDFWTIAITTGGALVAAVSAQGLFFQIVRRSDRRRRRREILVILAQCSDLVYENVRNGKVAAQWAKPNDPFIQDLSKKYWKLGTKALSLFEIREQVVARWTEVELHAGLVGFFHLLEDHEIPRRTAPAQQFLNGHLCDGPGPDGRFEYGPPRPSMLAEWAELRSYGPIYGSLETPGDESRHQIVLPNSDVETPERLSPVHELSPRGARLLGRWSETRKARYFGRLERRCSREWQRKEKDSLPTRFRKALRKPGDSVTRR